MIQYSIKRGFMGRNGSIIVTRTIISRGLYIFTLSFTAAYIIERFITQSCYYFVILISSNLSLPTEENKKLISILFELQYCLFVASATYCCMYVQLYIVHTTKKQHYIIFFVADQFFIFSCRKMKKRRKIRCSFLTHLKVKRREK